MRYRRAYRYLGAGQELQVDHRGGYVTVYTAGWQLKIAMELRCVQVVRQIVWINTTIIRSTDHNRRIIGELRLACPVDMAS